MRDLTQQAREIMEEFRRDHRHPGARLTLATLRHRLGTEPVITEAIRELHETGYLRAPDDETVELTPEGYDAMHRE